jgi:hypothetical protein
MEHNQEIVGKDSDRHREPAEQNREEGGKSFEVIVVYNGVKKPLKVHRDEPMKSVLDQAIALFGSLPNPHTLALFTESGHELPITGTVAEAGLKPGEKLLLRPSAVRGG